VRDAHSAYYLNALADREAALKGPREVQARDDIEYDLENVRAAWFWAITRGQWEPLDRAMEALWRYAQAQHRRADGRAAFQAVVDALEGRADLSPAESVRLGSALYRLASFTDDLGQSQTLTERGLDLLRAHGTPDQLAWPVMALAVTLVQRGELDRAQQMYDESLALAEAHGDQWTLAWVHRTWVC